MSTKNLATNPHATYGGGSDVGDLINRFGFIPTNPAWLRRKMQRLLAANAHDADEARDLLGMFDLDHRIIICEECGNDEMCEGYRYCSECLEESAR